MHLSLFVCPHNILTSLRPFDEQSELCFLNFEIIPHCFFSKKATCCGDNVHCCPNGFTCNHAKEQCVRAITNETTPWASKESTEVSASSSSSAEEAISPSNGYLCPNRVSACPVHAACCRTQSGSYRCCQYPYVRTIICGVHWETKSAFQ